MAFWEGHLCKESACNAGDTGDIGSIPGSGRSWQPTPVFFPGNSQAVDPGRLQSIGLQKVIYDLATKPPPQVLWILQSQTSHF